MHSTVDLADLQRIPGVGPSLARDLAHLGIRRVTDLRRRSPERLFDKLCALRGQRIDRCVLYVFRCAVYFASEPHPDPGRLKWWNWKDRRAVSALVRGRGSRGRSVADHRRRVLRLKRREA